MARDSKPLHSTVENDCQLIGIIWNIELSYVFLCNWGIYIHFFRIIMSKKTSQLSMFNFLKRKCELQPEADTESVAKNLLVIACLQEDAKNVNIDAVIDDFGCLKQRRYPLF